MSYVYYSTYDADGVSDKLNVGVGGINIRKDIPINVLEEAATLLPEGQRNDVLRSNYLMDNDIHIKDYSRIQVTYISNGTNYGKTHGNQSYQDAFGYYIYDTSDPPKVQDIEKYYIISPNASNNKYGGSLTAGDTIQLAYEFDLSPGPADGEIGNPTNFIFPPGKSIGFMIGANVWINGKNVHGRPKYYSRKELNPEEGDLLKYHTVCLELSTLPNMLMMGLEDLRRTWPHCDHDFNDLIVGITVEEGLNNIGSSFVTQGSLNVLSSMQNVGLTPRLGYKKIFVSRDGHVIEAVATLVIPTDADIIKKKDGKLRTNKATVLSIVGVAPKMNLYNRSRNNHVRESFNSGHSKYNSNYLYNVGESYTLDTLNTNSSTCGEGIHYFADFDQAANFMF